MRLVIKPSLAAPAIVAVLGLFPLQALAGQTPVTSQGLAATVAQTRADDGAFVNTMNMAVDRYNSDLDNLIRNVNQEYQNVRHDLEEEFMALRREHDQNTQKIFEQVRELKERRKVEQDRYKKDYDEFTKRMSDASIPASDRRFIDEANPFNLRKDREEKAYENTLSYLQRLYRLNDERFNEMVRIHDARMALEDQRYRELRDLASERGRTEHRLAIGGGSDRVQRRMQSRLNNYDQERNIIQQRYENSLSALEDLQDLVDNRIQAMRSYLDDHRDIMKNLAEKPGDADSIQKYTENLRDIREKRDAEEAKYQSNMKYLQERLAVEQMRTRELANVDAMVRQMESRWQRNENRLDQQRQELENRLSNATDAQRNEIQSRLDQLAQRRKEQQNAYDQTLDLIKNRRDVTEKALANRLDYLEERNKLRLRIADSEVSGENLADLRNEINKLEQQRIETEQQVQDQLMDMTSRVPAVYRESPWQGGSLEERKERAVNRLTTMKNRLDERWKSQQSNLDDQIKTYQARLNDSNLTPDQREELQQRIEDLQASKQRRESAYNEAVTALDQRREMQAQYLDRQADYMKKRADLLENIRAQNVSYEDLDKFNQQLRQLDSEWEKSEQEFRASMRPLRGLLPADRGGSEWQRRSRARWEAGVKRASQEADRRYASGEIRADRFDDDDDGAIMTGLRRVGQAIREGYHDVVDYLTD